MNIKSAALALAVLALVLAPARLSAQDPVKAGLAEWSNMRTVPAGDEVIVTLRSAETVQGRVRVVSDDSVSLTRKKNQLTFNRTEILRVHRIVPKSAKGATLLGTGIGAIVGAAVGAGVGHDSSDDQGLAVAFFGGIGAGFGAIAGFLVGSGKLKILVYEA